MAEEFEGPYEDLEGFLHRADELALVAAGAGHHRHEDLAVRPGRRGLRRPLHLRPPTSTGRWSRSARSATRSANRWTSWSSSTRCGTCRPPSASPARWSRSTPSGTRTRSRWTPGELWRPTPPPAARRSAPRRRWPSASPSASCWKRAPPASSCSTCPGAAACRRPRRSPPWPRPGTCRWRRTTAPARWCWRPRPISPATRPTR